MSKVTEPIKRTVCVTIEKEIEITLMPSMFGGMTEEEYLAEFSKGLWHVDSIDDVVKYAARMAAYSDSMRQEDGLGYLGGPYDTRPRTPDVVFNILYDSSEEEIQP